MKSERPQKQNFTEFVHGVQAAETFWKAEAPQCYRLPSIVV